MRARDLLPACFLLFTALLVWPLGAFVEYVKDGKSVDEVTARCLGLLAGR